MRERSLGALIPLILIIFIDSLGYMISIPVFLRLYTDHPHLFFNNTSTTLANTLFSLTMALGSFGYMLGAPLLGTWSDIWGRKKTLIFSLALSLLGFVLPIIGIATSTLIWIFIGRFIIGIASSSQSLAQTAIADFSKSKEKAWYFALVAIALTLSLLIGPTLGAYLSDPHFVKGFTETTPLLATLGLISFTLVLTLKFYRNTNDTAMNDEVLTFANFTRSLKSALVPTRIRLLFIIFFLYELGWSCYYQDISLYLTQNNHYSVTESAHFLAYTGIWMALGLIFLYKIMIRYFTLESLLNSSLAICTFSFFACTLPVNSFYQWIFVVPGAIAVGIIYPTIMTIISDNVDKNKQGCVLGFAAAAFSAPWCLSALFIGPLTNLSIYLPLLLAAFCFFCAMMFGYKITDAPYLVQEPHNAEN